MRSLEEPEEEASPPARATAEPDLMSGVLHMLSMSHHERVCARTNTDTPTATQPTERVPAAETVVVAGLEVRLDRINDLGHVATPALAAAASSSAR